MIFRRTPWSSFFNAEFDSFARRLACDLLENKGFLLARRSEMGVFLPFMVRGFGNNSGGVMGTRSVQSVRRVSAALATLV